jgi:hypothetical protein
MNPGARAPYDENSKKKIYFKVSEKFEIIHTCISNVDTYLCRFWHKKMTMCDLHINVKMGFPITVNSTQPIIIVSFGHFAIFM